METGSLPHTTMLLLVSISVVIYERYRISYTPIPFFPLRSKPDTPIHIIFYISIQVIGFLPSCAVELPPLFFGRSIFSQELNAFSGRYWQSVATVLLSSWISQTDFYFLTKIKFTAHNEILLIFFWKDSPLQNFFLSFALFMFSTAQQLWKTLFVE